MKKLLIGLLLLSGFSAYGTTTSTGTEAEGVINLTAYSAGALNMSLITKDIDFGNLRVYKAIPKEFKFTLKDDNLIGEVSTPAKITYRTT
ncbi:MAG: hypothetical protein ACRC5T_02915, partial [Cetobacterium sp.]